MFFKTQYSDNVPKLRSNPGSPFMDEYGYKYSKDGSKELVVIGQTDVHSRIQVDKDSCDINLIVKRFVQGDTSALDKVKGFYADTTDFPENYAELLQRVNDCNVMFERLPIEVKEKFNNSSDEFWSSFGSDHWMASLGFSDSVPSPIPESDPAKPEKHLKEGEE